MQPLPFSFIKQSLKDASVDGNSYATLQQILKRGDNIIGCLSLSFDFFPIGVVCRRNRLKAKYAHNLARIGRVVERPGGIKHRAQRIQSDLIDRGVAFRNAHVLGRDQADEAVGDSRTFKARLKISTRA